MYVQSSSSQAIQNCGTIRFPGYGMNFKTFENCEVSNRYKYLCEGVDDDVNVHTL